jgi:predicted nucleic acid-binding protein
MRAVLDNNILISALLSPLGAPAQILDARERKLFTLIACDDLINELRDVACRPFFRQRLRAGTWL